MQVKEVVISKNDALGLSQFKEMDYFAVENYQLPIELMMENAGLQLANLIVQSVENNQAKILIGVGNGNNGGGGLVAARRLSAWGFKVYIDMFTKINKPLPQRQMERAMAFGVSTKLISNPDVWVDAYLGFSQRLPLKQNLLDTIEKANQSKIPKISLDIPTGFLGDITVPYFKADKVMSLAASKKILYNLPESTDLFIADLGIPKDVYKKFNTQIPPFNQHNLLKINRTNG